MTTPPQTQVRVGFDIGGTFTDIVVEVNGHIAVKKTLSVLDTLVGEVRTTIEEALNAAGTDSLQSLVHATTVASNALLEGTYARVGLITTSGFRDDLELRRLVRPPIYDFEWERIPAIIPRRRRTEVTERISADGMVVQELDPASLSDAIETLSKETVEAIAIALLNSHVNPAHERSVELAARRAFPDIPISVSYDVLPKAGEYERASTTSVNASLAPTVNRYLDRIETELGVYAANMGIMQSNGGLLTPRQARRYPARIVESGPAAGVLCAAALAAELNEPRVVAFDMGGTTVKACLIEDGRPSEKYEYEVGGESHAASRYDRGTGYAVAIPSFDIVEAGSGGGSIAWSGNGILHVGPRSASADPGPACYQRGGFEPTVTDANVALGYINPKAIAGDTLAIDRNLAVEALGRLGEQFDLSATEVADGVHQVANAAMMRTLRAVTTERGHDPRDYTMVAFGGSGPVHAATLAELLGIRRVIVPPFPGVFSALGLLIAEARFDLIRNVGKPVDAVESAEVVDAFEALRGDILTEASRQGIEGSGIVFERYLDLRYLGQSSELVVQLPPAAAVDRDLLAELFHREHERVYGYSRSDEPIRLSNVRLKAFASTTKTSFRTIAQQFLADTRPWASDTRSARFGGGGSHEVPAVPRRALIGAPLRGPAIIEEPDTTVVVPPGWNAELDELGCIVLTPSD